MEDINDDVKNLYIIRRRLAELTRLPHQSSFKYYVGNFVVVIFTHQVMEQPIADPTDRVTRHNEVDVSLFEVKKDGTLQLPINLEIDSRFCNYQPIKYREWQGYSSGKAMPLNHLCELIKYLYRLSNLSAFM
jgi:hypothetical protein